MENEFDTPALNQYLHIQLDFLTGKCGLMCVLLSVSESLMSASIIHFLKCVRGSSSIHRVTQKWAELGLSENSMWREWQKTCCLNPAGSLREDQSQTDREVVVCPGCL